MKVYQIKAKIIPGTSYKEVEKIALKIFKENTALRVRCFNNFSDKCMCLASSKFSTGYAKELPPRRGHPLATLVDVD